MAHMVHSPPTTTATRLAAVVTQALEDSGVTQREAAEQTAIARTTLARKLRTGDFTVGELEELARLLRISVSDLIAAADDRTRRSA